ncbi:thiamine phosphate synthase [Arcobacter sp. FWKO B]|uniref:thiamine phosphate synthase n=1 Tax=Arcobacter sp. FWKO B TaxID=2593672 RepID=UPI0018A456C9|nr:thiamine phosphate synthase [Arcobacter sp. FWKO B]QOG12817.1 thiamine phosphate synthase [Arcobacter sp. FWKO B]
MRLYALCDFETLVKNNISLSKFIEIVSLYNPHIIQYRDKINPQTVQIENITFLKKHTNIPIIINDNLELTTICDGLHIGQEDLNKINKNHELAIKLIRKKIGSKILGLSTHNELEILEANKLDLDYIGLGAYRGTNTKDVSTILGDKLPYLAKISKHKVAAIGGIKLDDNIPNVYFHVIGSGLLGSKN